MRDRLRQVVTWPAGHWCALAYAALVTGLAPFVLAKWI